VIHSNSSFTSYDLKYSPPYDWKSILSFFKTHILEGVELVVDDAYFRTVLYKDLEGWLCVRHLPTHQILRLELSNSLLAYHSELVTLARAVFDIDFSPSELLLSLGDDAILGPHLRRNPGLRIPGAFDFFELCVRTILGQQVSVAAATTIAGRFSKHYGRKVSTPFPELYLFTPDIKLISSIEHEKIASHGIILTRAHSIVAIAKALTSKTLHLDSLEHDHDTFMKDLLNIRGIGPWTVQYILMRTSKHRDFFPKEDIALRKRLGRVTPKEADAISQLWRPWRSYATMHVWFSHP
jgi:AraC family transcriptional regulator, regulatory protein of adaptative response / DNA-3-methyladenine glycosylase II